MRVICVLDTSGIVKNVACLLALNSWQALLVTDRTIAIGRESNCRDSRSDEIEY